MSESFKNLILFIIVALILAGVFIYINYENKDLRNNGQLINVRIDNIDGGGKYPANSFICSFVYQGKIIKTQAASSVSKSIMRDLIGKSFPAMYSHKFDALEVLIKPQDFKKYNIPFPDSLNWVLEERY